MSGNVSVRHLNAQSSSEHWHRLGELHEQEIGTGFLTSLGAVGLARLYRAVARSRSAFIFAAFDGGAIVGFICGSVDTSRVMRECVLQSGFSLILSVAPKILSFKTIRKMAETVRYARDKKPQFDAPKAEILNFCVSADVQGKGIGRALFGSLIAEFKRRGVKQIKIVTGESQKSAQRFYEAVRAQHVGSIELHKGVQSVIYIYDIC